CHGDACQCHCQGRKKAARRTSGPADERRMELDAAASPAPQPRRLEIYAGDGAHRHREPGASSPRQRDLRR
ncbi:unnamed protein product, partial [Urochloa humidicola]